MFNHWIIAIVQCATRWPRLTVIIALVCSALSVAYTQSHFAINTDTSSLLSSKLEWRQRESQFEAAFPGRVNVIAVVIDAQTPELAERASAQLASRLSQEPQLFKTVRRPDAGPFFERNGLLFLTPEEVQRTTEQLVQAQPLLGTLAADPSARGVFHALMLVIEGVRRGDTTAEALARPVAALADTVQSTLEGKPPRFSLRMLLSDTPPNPHELRRFVLVQPVLDYSALMPGAVASDRIRAISRALALDPAHGVRVRLTGDVPLADEEFATLTENAGLNVSVSALSIIVLLWLAVRSGRAVIAILLSLVAGLAITAALGLAAFGSFNLISVAFAVLFVGLGVDFGIQFTVSYKAHRYTDDDIGVALARAARQVGRPLALAAASTALGFYAFLPTAYRGISELGVIAGNGMLIAFALTVTLLPALLYLLDAPAKRFTMGYAVLACVDRFLAAHRRRLLVVIAFVAIAAVIGAPHARFDFNPLHLRSEETESVSTLLDLMRDPDSNPNTVNVLEPSVAKADATAQRIATLPEVARTVTISSFVPEDQERKLALIGDAAVLLEPTLNPLVTQPPPDDQALVASMRSTAQDLELLAQQPGALGADAKRLQAGLLALVNGPPDRRAQVQEAIAQAVTSTLDVIRKMTSAGPVTLESLPKDLVADWVGTNGSARVEVQPRGDVNDNENLRRFVSAVQTIAPEATGTPVSIQESSSTIIRAFFVAGVWAWLAITALLALVLRKTRDVLLTLAPLVLSGLATLGLCAALEIALNFENIIALPLLLGVGVAFDIYFVMAWRAGAEGLLQSSLARAIIFSAVTTSTAFGSLWLSRHPGTSSMGELLALSLACTLVCTLFVLPVLLGPPRSTRRDS